MIIFKHFLFSINSRIIQHQIKMTDYVKKQHTAIFAGRIGCGKTDLGLDLIEKEYNKHLTTSLSPAQLLEIIMSHIIPRTGSRMMIRFGL